MIKVPMEMPYDCLECTFFFDQIEVPVGYLYKKACRCRFAPEEIEDPWRDIHSAYGHREEWCPLEEVEE